MKLNIGFQMDPMETIDTIGDSTFSIMLECYRRGHKIWHFLPSDLTFKNNDLFAKTTELFKIQDKERNYYKVKKEKILNLSSLDILFLRQDPPFNMSYITSTYLLESIEKKVNIINRPSEVRNAPEKLFLNKWPDIIPKTIISRDKSELYSFREKTKDIILKPLYGNGGSGVFFLRHDDKNFSSILEMFFEKSLEPIIAQEYLKEIKSGDKRIILINGVSVGAINRLPEKNEVRANLHVGGKAEPTSLSKEDILICESIGPELRKRGLLFVGIDIIGNKLTEINVTSPTGIREIDRFDGINLAHNIVDLAESL